MKAKVQIGAVLVIVGAVGVTGLLGFEYRRDHNGYQKMYTEIVKQRDIADTAHNAVSALEDAELQEQYYVLTGETSYFEAYGHDVGIWQDELATLELLSEHDPSKPIVRDLLKSGTGVLDELAKSIAVRNGKSPNAADAALVGIRRGSAIVYLEQTRDLVAKIMDVNGRGANSTDLALINRALKTHNRLVAGVGALFFLTLAGTFLSVFGGRRGRQPSADITSREGLRAGITH